MPIMTVEAAKKQAVRSSMARGQYDPASIFAAINSVTAKTIQVGVAASNTAIDYQQQLGNYYASQQNARTDYREAMAAYNTKKALLNSDAEYTQYQLDALAPTFKLQSDYASKLLITAQEQLSLVKSLPDPLEKYNLAKEKHDTTVSFSQQLLDNLDDQFDIQKKLLDRKFEKDDGRSEVRFNASGFGGIGMQQAISSDIQAQKRLEISLAEANKETEAIQKRYNIDLAGIDLKGADLQYKSDVVNQKSQALSAEANVIDRQYNIDKLGLDFASAQADLNKKATDTQTQLDNLLAPTKRALGPAPAEKWVSEV